jgi:mevalonate kinase
VNHALLNALGVGHAALERIVAVTRAHGLTTKLTGAGGGGCAITLLPHATSAATVAAVRAELEGSGFDCWDVTLGAEGARIHDETAFPPRDDYRRA